MIPWDEEQIGLLRQMWADGASTAEIGKKLHITRNAVSGKIHRLGLSRNKKESSGSKPRPEPTLKVRPPVKFVDRPTEAAPDAPGPVKIMELQSHHCRAILSGFGADALYCGAAAVEGEPWCEHHRGIYYNPDVRRRRVA